MFQSLIEEINSLQKKRLSEISLINNKLNYNEGAKTKEDGMYWIYTNHSNKDFIDSVPCTKKGSIVFSDLVTKNLSVNELCQEEIDGFRLVYSGIGGVGPKGSGGLRERILEEYRGGSGTGSLAIKDSSLSDLSCWRVSYVLWSELKFPKDYEYRPFSTAIEGLWRLHYGWPLLCTK
jgi:hypothetical protein